MIPEAAVEAAASGMWEERPMQRTTDGAPLPFAEAKNYQRIRYIAQARAALDAAAQHMLRDAQTRLDRVAVIASRLEGSKQCEDREIAEDLRAALTGLTK